MKEERIRRFVDVELRASKENEGIVDGYPIVFNVATDLGWFTEEIDRHALDNADMSDVVLLLNHDNNLLLAGTRNNSLELQVKDTGLFQSSKIVETTQGKDVLKLVKDGLITKMSFAFTIDGKDGEEWQDRNGKEHRIIKRIKRLYDVSLVTFPAYSQTSAYARGMSDELAEEHKALMEKRANQDKKMEEILNA